MRIYDFKVLNNHGEVIPLDVYEGMTILIVNTATKCGLTSQYSALEELYQKYKQKRFVILDFPCNQFLKQTPGTDAEIDAFCKLHYHTTFPRFAKVDVNGKDAEPLFTWLKEQISYDQGNGYTKSFEKRRKLLKPFSTDGDITWNFCKFLINRKGKVVGRFSPALTPQQLEDSIQSCLDILSKA